MRVPDFRKIVKFKRGFWEKLGKKTVIWHKINVQIDNRDARSGRLFTLYTTRYAKDKKAGKAVKPGETQRSKQVIPPNLTLTGKMMDAFKFIRSSNTGFLYGITDPKEAKKMIGNQSKRRIGGRPRIVSNQEYPLPRKVKKQVTTAIAGKIAQNLKDVFTADGKVVRIIKI